MHHQHHHTAQPSLTLNCQTLQSPAELSCPFEGPQHEPEMRYLLPQSGASTGCCFFSPLPRRYLREERVLQRQ